MNFDDPQLRYIFYTTIRYLCYAIALLILVAVFSIVTVKRNRRKHSMCVHQCRWQRKQKEFRQWQMENPRLTSDLPEAQALICSELSALCYLKAMKGGLNSKEMERESELVRMLDPDYILHL